MKVRQATAIPSVHPLHRIAAVSVTLFSLAGIGVLAGWLPGPAGQTKASEPLATRPAATMVRARQDIVPPRQAAAAEPVASTSALLHRDPPAAPVPAAAASPAPTFVAERPLPTIAVVESEAARTEVPPQASVCAECGVVEAVHEIVVEPQASGGGAIAGGLLGGLIANRIGKGSGRTIATVLGAAGGAWAGNQVEKKLRAGKRYEVLVRFDDGTTRSFNSETPPTWQSGDRVKLQNGLLTMGGGRSNASPGMV